MKVFKYLVALVAGVMAFTACEKDPADLYGVEATAPVMDSHADILLTENSTTETVTFSWKAARGMGEDVLYTLYATLDGQETTLATTNATFFTADKEALRDLLLTGFNLPGNDNFSIGMYVAADNGLTVMKSEAITMNVYVYGDYVPAIVSVNEEAAEGVVLTEAMTENIELINWTAARFEYGTNPLYKVEISYNDGERQVLAEGIATTSYAVSPSMLNSMLIALGCPKDAASDVKLIVTSYLEGEGAAQLESEAVTVTITTYTPSYPETLSLVGDFGGLSWGDTVATSPILKGDPNTGVYNGLVSYYGATWGMKVYYLHPKTEEAVWVGGQSEDGLNYTIGAAIGDNIAPEEGSYIVYVDLSQGTMTLTKVETIGLIGDFNSWGEQTNMTYNAETGAFELEEFIHEKGTFKIRVNDGWDLPTGYNLGGDMNDMVYQGANISPEPGAYKVTMKLSGNENFKLNLTKVGDVEVEEPTEHTYSLAGTINNWTVDDKTYTFEKGQNGYVVYKNLTLTADAEFKVVEDYAWTISYGLGEGASVVVGEKVTLTSANGANMKPGVEGAYDLYFNPETATFVMVAAGSADPTVGEVKESIYGLVGVHNNWSAPDVRFTDMGTGEHVLLGQALGASEGFKIRANDDWNDAENYGSLNGGIVAIDTEITLVCGGGSKDMMVETAGTYDLYFYPADLKLYVMTPGKTPTDAGEPEVPPTPTETVYSVAGGFNSWGETDMTDNGDGFFVLKNQALTTGGDGFKFKKNHSWADADCWGVDAATTVTVGEAITLIQPGANIPVPADGTFDIYFNPTTATAYVMNAGEVPGTPAPAAHTYSLVGSFNGWNQTDTTYTMTASAADTYTFSNIALAAYDEFKIVEDYAWTVSYGAAATVALDQKFALTSDNGGNIVMPATGTFNITFYAATSELLIEAVGPVTYPTPGGEDISIGLVGDMTGWSATGDILFTKQAGGVYTIESVALTAAQGFKVRKTPTAEKEWDDRYNWGLAASGALTTGVDNDLICGGGAGNIFVAEDGNYKVTFTPATDDKGVIPSQPAKIKVEKIASEPETPSTPAQTLEWSSSLFEQFYNSLGGDNYTEDVDLGNGLKFIAGGSKCKFGSNSGAYRIQLGGSGNTTKCTLQLDVTGPGTLEVDIQSSGDAARYLAVAVDGTEVTPAEGLEAPDKNSGRQVYKVDCSSAKAGSVINMYSKGSAINVFVVKWTPAQ